jgi:hypothetical protein
VTFEDFNEGELRNIFLSLVRSRGWTIEAPTSKTAAVVSVSGGSGGNGSASGGVVDVASIAARRLAQSSGRRGFANARSVRVAVEAALNRANTRITSMPREDLSKEGALTTLTRADVLGTPINADTSPAMRELSALPGLTAIKESIFCLLQLARDNFVREENGLPAQHISLHRLFLGNPGTGKTVG